MRPPHPRHPGERLGKRPGQLGDPRDPAHAIAERSDARRGSDPDAHELKTARPHLSNDPLQLGRIIAVPIFQ